MGHKIGTGQVGAEIEVSEAMVEAGVWEYVDWYARQGPYREGERPLNEMVSRIFRAMEGTRSASR